MWLILFVIALALVIAGAVYMIFQVIKFSPIDKITSKNKRLGVFVSFLIIALCFSAVCFFLSFIDALVVFFSTLMFFLIFGAVGAIKNKITGKTEQGNLPGLIAIITSIVYLCIAYFLCNHVWQKNYVINTDKDVESIKIALFADSHLGATFDGDGFSKEMKKIEEQEPDILLIAGDMVDDSSKRADLEKACETLGKMNIKYGVWFSFGNHDEGYMRGRDFSGQDLREILTKNGINVLEDKYSLIDDRFYVVGRVDASYKSRKSIGELLSGLDTSKYIIVLDHQPNDYDNEAVSDADLVVSGHTHGGQLFPITYLGEWFKINDMTYGHKKINGTDFIVTSGISDWAIKFKSGTNSEYVIIDVEKEGAN